MLIMFFFSRYVKTKGFKKRWQLTFLEVVHDVIRLHVKVSLLQLDVLGQLLHDVGFCASGGLSAQEAGLLLRHLAKRDLGMSRVEIDLLGFCLLALSIVD